MSDVVIDTRALLERLREDEYYSLPLKIVARRRTTTLDELRAAAAAAIASANKSAEERVPDDSTVCTAPDVVRSYLAAEINNGLMGEEEVLAWLSDFATAIKGVPVRVTTQPRESGVPWTILESWRDVTRYAPTAFLFFSAPSHVAPNGGLFRRLEPAVLDLVAERLETWGRWPSGRTFVSRGLGSYPCKPGTGARELLKSFDEQLSLTRTLSVEQAVATVKGEGTLSLSADGARTCVQVTVKAIAGGYEFGYLTLLGRGIFRLSPGQSKSIDLVNCAQTGEYRPIGDLTLTLDDSVGAVRFRTTPKTGMWQSSAPERESELTMNGTKGGWTAERLQFSLTRQGNWAGPSGSLVAGFRDVDELTFERTLRADVQSSGSTTIDVPLRGLSNRSYVVEARVEGFNAPTAIGLVSKTGVQPWAVLLPLGTFLIAVSLAPALWHRRRHARVRVGGTALVLAVVSVFAVAGHVWLIGGSYSFTELKAQDVGGTATAARPTFPRGTTQAALDVLSHRSDFVASMGKAGTAIRHSENPRNGFWRVTLTCAAQSCTTPDEAVRLATE